MTNTTEYMRNYMRRYREETKQKVFQHYSKRSDMIVCEGCNVADLEVLCIDHPKGNGSIERKVTGLGSNFYDWLIKNNLPKGYRILCHNCNWKSKKSHRRY